MRHDPYDFKFAGRWLSEFGGRTKKRPKREIAELDFSLIDIAGKNGKDFVNNKRYKNVEISRQINIITANRRDPAENAEQLIRWLAYAQGYQEFEDTDHEGLISYAVLTNFPEVINTLDVVNSADLEFSRQPFWYLKTSIKNTAYSAAETLLHNPFPIASEPKITFRFNRAYDPSPVDIVFRITTDGESADYVYEGIDISDSETLTIDCEEREAHMGYANNNMVYLDLPIPEYFGIGDTTIQVTYGSDRLASLSIAPRWRCL